MILKAKQIIRSLQSEMQKIIIAIDGFSSTGKSTLAKQLAAKLNYTYVDSGAMYRAITYFFLQQHIDLSDTQAIQEALQKIQLHFEANKICLNGVNIDAEIRDLNVANHVSQVATLEQVRNFAVLQQQHLGTDKGIVMDGRDIGTTVFPNAELKIFLTANQQIRTQRRYDEMKVKNESILLGEVEANLAQRDHLDSTREISPLRKANDAVDLDNSHLTMEQQLQIAYEWALQKIQNT